jgi:FkbM family methyltransferase
MMKAEEIQAAYRILLGRPPESEAIVDYLAQHFSAEQLGRQLLSSAEFRRRASLGDLPMGTQRWVCAEIGRDLRLWVDLFDLGVGAGVLRNDWEPHETRFILSQLGDGDCFIDIGANIGWFTILAAHRVGLNGQVHAFEPRPDLFRRLTQSVVENGMQDWCFLYNEALGTEVTEMSIAAIPSEFNAGHSFLVKGSLDPKSVEVARVPVRPLDSVSFARKVDLVKIDVEGAEGLVLSGARAMLERDRPVIVSEFFPAWLRKVSGIEPGAYLDLLHSYGYRLFELTDEGLGAEIVGLPVRADDDGFFVNIVAVPHGHVLRPISTEPMSAKASSYIAGISNLGEAMYRELLSDQRAQIALTSRSLKGEMASTLKSECDALRREHGMQLAQASQQMQTEIQSISKQLQTLALAQADLGGAMARLEERLPRRPSMSIGAKIIREIRRPFTRQFWQRRKEKIRARRALRRLGANQVSAPQWKTPEEVRGARAQAPCLAGSHRPVMMLIDDRFPEPDRDSGSLDTINIIQSFVAFGYHVVMGVQTSRVQDPRYGQLIRNLGAFPMTSTDAPSIQAFIETFGVHVDLFMLNRVGTGGQFLELIRYHCPESKIIFNTVDLHYIREARAARLVNDMEALSQSERTRDREEFLVGKADLTLVVSSVEQEILAASVPGAPTLLTPLARPIRVPSNGFAKRSGLGFVGGFEHAPNVDALRYFLTEIWPLIHVQNPELHFDIVGSALPPDVLQGVGGPVRYLGAIDNLDDWLDSLRMTVAPLRIGAGAKGKVASSLCAGVPCVLTSVAAEGMDLEDGIDVLVGTSSDHFAKEVLRLNNDPELWSALSQGGLAYAQRRLSVANYTESLRRAVIGMGLPAFAISAAVSTD